MLTGSIAKAKLKPFRLGKVKSRPSHNPLEGAVKAFGSSGLSEHRFIRVRDGLDVFVFLSGEFSKVIKIMRVRNETAGLQGLELDFEYHFNDEELEFIAKELNLL